MITYKLHDIGVHLLCEAILMRAADDYRHVLRFGDHEQFKRYELEKFFKGKLFGAMLGGLMGPQEFMETIVQSNSNDWRKSKRWVK